MGRQAPPEEIDDESRGEIPRDGAMEAQEWRDWMGHPERVQHMTCFRGTWGRMKQDGQKKKVPVGPRVVSQGPEEEEKKIEGRPVKDRGLSGS